MKLGTMFSDVARALVGHTATRRYPAERTPTPARLRGQVHWDPTRCTACRMCVMDCPANALDLLVIDKASHQFVLRYDAGHCTFCGQCALSCNYGCLRLSNDEWELAGANPDAMVVYYGAPDDVEHVLAAPADAGARQSNKP